MSPPPDTTSWQLILDSARGDPDSRARFAARYERLIRNYLGHRWREATHIAELDDAVQEIFLECFREGGALARVDPERLGGFRAFLFGVVRHVALRIEDRGRRTSQQRSFDEVDSDLYPLTETSISQHMDREWAQAILREAVRIMEERASTRDEAARLRVEILRLRFDEGMPIRDIAKRWETELIPLHQQYTRARREFKSALKEVLYPGASVPDDLLQREVEELSSLLRGR